MMGQETASPLDLLASIVNSSFDGIISQTLDGTVTSWNPAAAKLFGYESGEIIGQSIRRLIPIDRQEEEDQNLAMIAAGERVESYETVRLHKNGSPIDVLLTISPIWNPDGKIAGASKIYRDYTSQKRAAESLRRSEARLREFVEQAPAAIAMFDREMRYIACSGRWFTQHGRDEHSVVIGLSHYEVFPEIPERWKEVHRRGLAGEVLRAEEDSFVRADGAIQWLCWEVRPWLTSDKTVGGITIMAEDATERVAAVRALRDSELRTRLAQEAAKSGTWELRLADNRSQWSETIWRLYGLKPEDRTPCFDAWVSSVHPEDRERVTNALRDAIATGQEYENQWRVNLPQGEPERWLFSRGRPIAGANGTVERYIGVVIDITERKHMEEALRKAEELERQKREELETILAAMPAAVVIAKDADCIEMAGNRSAFDLLRLAPSEDLSKSAPPERAPKNFEVFANGRRLSPDEMPIRRAAASKTAIIGEELEVRFVEGDSKFVLTNALPLFDDKGQVRGAVGAFADVTELKRTEAALRKAEELERQKRGELEAILAAIPTPVLIATDASCENMIGNPAAYELYRVPPGANFSKSAPVGEAPANFEIYQNGRRLPPEQLPIRKAAATRAFSGEEIELRFVEGDSKYLLGNALPLFNDAGEVRGAVAAFADVTELKRAETALRESEERLRLALDAANAGTWESVPETGEFFASDRALALHGAPAGTPLSREKAVGAVHPEDRSRVEENFRRAVARREPLRHEFRFLLPDGSIRWVESRGEPRTVSGRQVISGLLLDITERKRAEIALRESEERLKFALEAAGAGTWQVTQETGEFIASDRTLALHGLPPGAPMTHEKALANVHPEDQPRVEETLRRTLETGEPFRVETRVMLPGGSIRWIESCGELRSVFGRQVIGGLVQDITERKQTEQALREREELLASIIKHAPNPIILWREDRKVLLMNPAVTELSGYTASDIPTRDEWEVLAYRETAPRGKEDFDRTFESGLPADIGDRWVYTKSGEKRLWSLTRAPAGRDAFGRRLIVGVALDITERKKSEEEALANKSKLKAALAAMRDGVFILDAESRFIHFNEAFARFHKFKSKEDCAQTFSEYPDILTMFLPNGEQIPPEEWPSQRALRGETATAAEYTIKRRDGQTYIGSYNFAPIRDTSSRITGAVVSVRDITDEKHAANRLRESEARLSSIIDTAADSIIVIDEKGIIQSANRATEGIFGYALDELVGRNIGMLMAPSLAAQHDRFLIASSGKGAVRQVDAKRKDGAMVPIDGAVTEWRDGEGRRFFTGIMRDLTERKRNEQALANARRLEAVGQLAGGVAHDFNNLLHAISGNLEIAQDLIGDEATRSFLERARNAAEKGSALNRRLLSLARKRTLKPERLNLNDRVQETAKLLASTVGEHISVTIDLAAGLWITLADSGEIDSAILNLAANARDAMPGGGSIRIATSNVSLDAAAAKLHQGAAPGDYVRLAIADNGVGMPQGVLDKATEAFFTTKGPGAGTGLGLTSVASFAGQTGGFMSIESAPGHGCTVMIYLPRATQGPVAQGLRPSGVPLGRGQLILVVEDDDEVREVTLKRLELLGYSTAEAKTGPEALERLTSQAEVQLVLSDIVMPGGMTGYDVARWVGSNTSNVKVIMCSGYNEGDRIGVAQGAIDGIITLSKPYTRDQLARALSSALAL